MYKDIGEEKDWTLGSGCFVFVCFDNGSKEKRVFDIVIGFSFGGGSEGK